MHAEGKRKQSMQKNTDDTVPAWEATDECHLYTVAQLVHTPLGVIPRRTLYDLIAQGALRCLSLGSRRFVTKRAITNFIEASDIPR
jgi:hypothetical protein